jgi:hypothetical protein
MSIALLEQASSKQGSTMVEQEAEHDGPPVTGTRLA